MAFTLPTLPKVRSVLRDVSYRNWQFELVESKGHAFVQAVFPAPSSKTGTMEIQRGRPWLVSDEMTRGEIVRTLFRAVLTAEEHEARESFFYRSVPVMNPHFDLEEGPACASNA